MKQLSFYWLTFLFIYYVQGFGEKRDIHEIRYFDPQRKHYAIAFGEDGEGYINFHVENGSEVYEGDGDMIAASIFYIDTNTTGWTYLTVHTNKKFNDVIQAYWAGYTEGQVTWTFTQAHYYNMAQGYCTQPYDELCTRLEKYILQNLQWMKTQVIKYRETDPFWHQIELQLWQLKGLEDAFLNRSISSSSELGLDAFRRLTLDPFGIFLLQLNGDLEDLSPALGQREKRLIGNGACSALIKVLPENADLYVAHTTWGNYEAMLRVLKHYELYFSLTAKAGSKLIPAVRQSFSSYPSLIFSLDDFFIMGTGLATTETTIGNYNESLWKHIAEGAESGVFEFFRVQVANRLAETSHDWPTYFSRFNSGTYDNQWMVVDYKKFTPGKELPDDGLLVVVEQMPDDVEVHDMTQTLKKNSYWSSYNIPAFENVFERLNYTFMVKEYGDWFSHEGSPRGQIFKRDHMKVKNMETMIDLMRYNDYLHDPLSKCNCTPPYSAENAIAARSDLNDPSGIYPFEALAFRDHGATDLKVVNSSLIQKMHFVAISGPTHTQVPVFKWSNSTFNTRHSLHPDEWNFPPIITPF